MTKILLLGKAGQLGHTLVSTLPAHGEVLALDRAQGDLENLEQLRQHIRAFKPNIIVNAAAYTAVDQAEKEPERARLINATAVKLIAEEALLLNAWLIHYSTDYVFDGTKETPYLETDTTHPINVYGASKREGELAIEATFGKYFIFRTSWVYSAHRHNFALAILKKASSSTELNVVNDTIGVPTSTRLLADITSTAIQQIVNHPEKATNGVGIYHLTPAGKTTWFDYARLLIRLARECDMPVTVPDEGIRPVGSDFYPTVAKRPKNSCLNTDKLSQQFGVVLPDWREDVIALLQEIKKTPA